MGVYLTDMAPTEPSPRCPDHPDSRLIPGFTRYCIDTKGNVFSHRSNVWCKPHQCIKPSRPGKDGNYDWFYYLIPDHTPKTGAKYQNLQRHRAVLLSHVGKHNDPAKNTVNHINGIPGDDRLENLEWNTLSENLRHSYDTGLRTNQTVGMESWDILTGEIKSYKSVPDFMRETGMPNGTIRKRLKRNNAIIYDGKYRYRRTDTPWSEEDPEEVTRQRFARGERPIVVYNSRDNTTTVFKSTMDAVRSLSKECPTINEGSINCHIRANSLNLLHGYCFRSLEDKDTIPYFSPEIKAIAKKLNYPDKIPCFVTVLNKRTNTIRYERAIDVLEKFGYRNLPAFIRFAERVGYVESGDLVANLNRRTGIYPYTQDTTVAAEQPIESIDS